MCENPYCKFINIYEIKRNVKIFIHFNSDFEPILIQYLDNSDIYKKVFKDFLPKEENPIDELKEFHISLEEIKNENFDLTEMFILDAEY